MKEEINQGVRLTYRARLFRLAVHKGGVMMEVFILVAKIVGASLPAIIFAFMLLAFVVDIYVKLRDAGADWFEAGCAGVLLTALVLFLYYKLIDICTVAIASTGVRLGVAVVGVLGAVLFYCAYVKCARAGSQHRAAQRGNSVKKEVD